MIDDISNYIPKLIMLSNGIYYDGVMDYITKSFSQSIDDNIIEKIKGNIIRGITLQTGIRIESDNGITCVRKSLVLIENDHLNEIYIWLNYFKKLVKKVN